MNDPGLNQLLKWSVENSDAGRNDASDEATPRVPLDQDALARLMGAPSDADMMKAAMASVQSPDVKLENKLIAFDNFEQLIENLDNANNMESLGLWMPLVELLADPESEIQRMAAWCVGTAVQNNPQSQERLLALGGIPKLVDLSLHGATPALRKKAIFALSSEVRNYQPGFDEFISELPISFRGEDKLDAADMEAVDVLINRLRESVQ